MCKLIGGAWHLVTLKPLPGPFQRDPGSDVILGRGAMGLDPAEARRQYGAAVYAVAVRRLSRREIRQLPIPADSRL